MYNNLKVIYVEGTKHYQLVLQKHWIFYPFSLLNWEYLNVISLCIAPKWYFTLEINASSHGIKSDGKLKNIEVMIQTFKYEIHGNL